MDYWGGGQKGMLAPSQIIGGAAPPLPPPLPTPMQHHRPTVTNPSEQGEIFRNTHTHVVFNILIRLLSMNLFQNVR